MRRSFLGMLTGLPLIGDGLVRPQNAPPAGTIPPGVQPGVSNTVIVANRVIVFGSNGGIFIYSPSPGPGNLVESMTATAGTDPYGNAYNAGVQSYLGGAAGIVSGAFFLYSGPPYVSFFSIGPGTLGRAQFGGAGFTSTGGTPSAPTVITTDTSGGQTYANANSWTGTLKYKLLPVNAVQVNGQLTAPAGVANPSIVNVAPAAAYLPADTQYISAVEDPGGAHLGQALICQVLAAGTIQVFDATAGDSVRFSGIYSLDM